MKIIFDPPLTERVQYFLKRCGYREILDRKSGRRSWVRPLNRSGHYPRFHCHIAEHLEAGMMTAFIVNDGFNKNNITYIYSHYYSKNIEKEFL